MARTASCKPYAVRPRTGTREHARATRPAPPRTTSGPRLALREHVRVVRAAVDGAQHAADQLQRDRLAQHVLGNAPRHEVELVELPPEGLEHVAGHEDPVQLEGVDAAA
eukprot:15458950-Alexandrium_andersonii.AAC.1